MVYYKNNGECVKLDCFDSSFNKGTQASIYRMKNEHLICFKSYDDDDKVKTIFDDSGNKFTQEMFDYFKNQYEQFNFCKLYDLLYDKRMATVMGYTMKYYEEIIDNMLFLPTSYILDNFSIIYDAIDKLTKDCIKIVDLNCDNIIDTKDGLIVLDYDKYYRDLNIDVDTLNYINKCALMYAFKGIFLKSLKRHGIEIDNNLELKCVVNSLFTINTSPIVLKYKLRNYMKPIDLFIK